VPRRKRRVRCGRKERKHPRKNPSIAYREGKEKETRAWCQSANIARADVVLRITKRGGEGTRSGKGGVKRRSFYKEGENSGGTGPRYLAPKRRI